MSLTLRQYVTAILRGQYDVADVPCRLFGYNSYRAAFRKARQRQGANPLPIDADPAEICGREGLGFHYASVPGRCGLHHPDGTIILPWEPHAPTRALLQTHEWTHNAFEFHGAMADATEADAWHATALRVRDALNLHGLLWRGVYPYAPAWMVELVMATRQEPIREG